MATKHYSPLTCCDSDCAGVNHCRIGGYKCERCGCWVCAGELNEDGYCADCEEAILAELDERENEDEA